MNGGNEAGSSSRCTTSHPVKRGTFGPLFVGAVRGHALVVDGGYTVR
jgi:hypothetical protein